MKIILYEHHTEASLWLDDLARALPGADVRLWQPGDTAPADYAVVWRKPPKLFAHRLDLKAVFNLGAGVEMPFSKSNASSPAHCRPTRCSCA